MKPRQKISSPEAAPDARRPAREYPVLGHSMRFLLEPGDTVAVRPCAPGEPRPGDVTLLLRWRGGLPAGYVLHRTLINASPGGRRIFLSKGDSNFLPDLPPGAYQPVGIAEGLARGKSAILASLYSLAASKALYLPAAAAVVLFRLVCLLRPFFLARQLSSLYLAWERDAYPFLRDTLAVPVARVSGPARPAAVRTGRVVSDEVWEGRVTVADYLVVEPGASVTVRPGTEIVFERRAPWFFPVLRCGEGGAARELESGGAKMLVYGSFEAGAQGGEQVRIGGDAFSGIHALGSGRARLSGCLVSGSRACAVSAWDDASLYIRDCSFSGCARGVELYGGSSARADDCLFATDGAAMIARDSSCLSVAGGSAECRGAAAELGDSARAAFMGFSSRGCGRGFSLSGRASLLARGCDVSGSRGPAARCLEGSAFFAADCVFSGNSSGIEAFSRSSAELERCVFSENRGPASFSAGRARVSARECRFFGNAVGLHSEGSSCASLAACSLEGQSGEAARFSGSARGSVSRSVFSGNARVLVAEDSAAVEAADCSFRENGGPAADISGSARLSLLGSDSAGESSFLALSDKARISLEDCSADIRGAAAASVEGRASLSAAASSLRSSSDAVYARGAPSLSFRKCSLRAGTGAALDMEGGAAEVTASEFSGAGGLRLRGVFFKADGLDIKAAEYAADCGGADLELRGLRSRGGPRGGVSAAGGKVFLEGASIEDAPEPGLSFSAVRPVCRNVLVGGLPWRPEKSRRPSVVRKYVSRFAAGTAGSPVFSAAYRGLYKAGALAAGAFLRPGPDWSVHLYRGMASPDWTPGLSDMDLALLAPDLPPDGDWEAFSSLRRRLDRFRLVFPFTSEVLIAPSAAFSSLVSRWGLKGSEFRTASRPLAGPRLMPSPPAEPGPADMTEAFYSYTIMFSHFLSDGLPPAFRKRNCLKGLADVRRYLDGTSPARASRKEYAASIGLDPDDTAASDPAEAAFGAFRALHAASPAERSAEPRRGETPRWFNAHAFASACGALRDDAGCDAGVALDPLYRVYLILPDEAAGDREMFLRSCRALNSARARFRSFSAAPLALTRSSFALLSGLPYLNNPLFRRDLAAGAAGLSQSDGGVFLWNTGLPPAAVRPDKAAVSFAALHFAATWRSLWGGMPPHYFYTRAAGLRLLMETGDSPPFSRPDEVSARSLSVFGPGLAWAEFRAGGDGRRNYEFVARHSAAAREAPDAS